MRSNIVRTASGARVTATTRRQPIGALGALRCLEERGQGVKVLLTLVGKRGHRAAFVDARGAAKVGDLERDALVLRALGAQVRRTQVVGAGAEIGVAVE